MLCSIFQRYKSRAIHNNPYDFDLASVAVFNISKIQIESNSQPGILCWIYFRRCVQYFKDTNREQFTTENRSCSIVQLLCSIFQRYKSRAIHNNAWIIFSVSSAVFNISKIQIESNSQRFCYTYKWGHCCVQYFKDTNREQFTTEWNSSNWCNPLCSIFQRYKSRAIHNFAEWYNPAVCAVFNISKIQIESNSQHRRNHKIWWNRCVQYFKDTNREQFTTYKALLISFAMLCSIFQRYKSRAIHNTPEDQKKLRQAVFNISKIQIESNSQPT